MGLLQSRLDCDDDSGLMAGAMADQLQSLLTDKARLTEENVQLNRQNAALQASGIVHVFHGTTCACLSKNKTTAT